jgi:hypothetical protein
VFIRSESLTTLEFRPISPEQIFFFAFKVHELYFTLGQLFINFIMKINDAELSMNDHTTYCLIDTGAYNLTVNIHI